MTLAYGSIMQLYIREYKKDPADQTMALNACIVEPMNADFDGDALYLWFLFENKMARDMSAVHPSQFIFSTTNPGLSARIGLLKQNIICCVAWLEDDAEDSAHYEELA